MTSSRKRWRRETLKREREKEKRRMLSRNGSRRRRNLRNSGRWVFVRLCKDSGVWLQVTRTERVDSWRSFQDSKAKRKKKGKAFSTGIKPPKMKLEKRT